MKCPQCRHEEAIVDREYGVLPGNNCQAENEAIPKPKKENLFDFASPLTKLYRKEYGSDMYQPYVNGCLSKEFVDTYGSDKLAGVSKNDIKNAKYAYGNMTRHHKTIQNAKTKKIDVSKRFERKI